jgi:hypothetical protein
MSVVRTWPKLREWPPLEAQLKRTYFGDGEKTKGQAPSFDSAKPARKGKGERGEGNESDARA